MSKKGKRRLKNRILCLILIVFCCFFMYGCASNRISETEIEGLREEYPTYGINAPEHIDIKFTSFEETEKYIDTFVYGEIVGQTRIYTKNILTGIEELDKKREENGISSTFSFRENIFRVTKDTKGYYNEGDEIILTTSEELLGYLPEFKEGMKLIIPVAFDSDDNKNADYTVKGMYHVTEDGFCIAAFDEETYSKLDLSGRKIEEVLKELKKYGKSE